MPNSYKMVKHTSRILLYLPQNCNVFHYLTDTYDPKASAGKESPQNLDLYLLSVLKHQVTDLDYLLRVTKIND